MNRLGPMTLQHHVEVSTACAEYSLPYINTCSCQHSQRKQQRTCWPLRPRAPCKLGRSCKKLTQLRYIAWSHTAPSPNPNRDLVVCLLIFVGLFCIRTIVQTVAPVPAMNLPPSQSLQDVDPEVFSNLPTGHCIRTNRLLAFYHLNTGKKASVYDTLQTKSPLE
jgi:hypothetical protein